MTAPRRPLAGRVVLVVGAGDRDARTAALRLSALGAGLVVSAPEVRDAAETAGLAAAAGRTARVVEAPAPPLAGAELLAAARALAPVTDALVAETAFGGARAARAAAAQLADGLGPGARVLVLEAEAGGGACAQAARVADAFLGRRG